MNFNTYGSYYAQFHQCTISSVRHNIILFRFGVSSYENWLIMRLIPPDHIFMDSKKPLVYALKACFKSDVMASVVCNSKYLWTVVLGKERVIFPIGREAPSDNTLHYYATPFYVKNTEVVKTYLPGTIHPPYENVFFYKNSVLFLDNEDLPYPGGNYFAKRDPVDYYRICFLSTEPVDAVLKLAEEWHLRDGVETIPYMSREVVALPKMIPFQPVSAISISETHKISSKPFPKTLGSKKPEHMLLDILNAYYKLSPGRSTLDATDPLGLLIDWPLHLALEGGRTVESETPTQNMVALCVNGHQPDRVLRIYRPYDLYTEYAYVPPTLWTPVDYEPLTLVTDATIRKVAIDTVVVGVVYRDAFFCFEQPLLEGNPVKKHLLNAQSILSIADFDLKDDPKLNVVQTIQCSEQYCLSHVILNSVTSLRAWCFIRKADQVSYPKRRTLPKFIEQWRDFFLDVKDTSFEVDIHAVRLAMMLSKHNLCFKLVTAEKETSREICKLSDNDIVFYLNEKTVQFINDARLFQEEPVDAGSRCILS